MRVSCQSCPAAWRDRGCRELALGPGDGGAGHRRLAAHDGRQAPQHSAGHQEPARGPEHHHPPSGTRVPRPGPAEPVRGLASPAEPPATSRHGGRSHRNPTDETAHSGTLVMRVKATENSRSAAPMLKVSLGKFAAHMPKVVRCSAGCLYTALHDHSRSRRLRMRFTDFPHSVDIHT